MAHIPLPEGMPGIVGAMKAYPAAAKHLNGLAQELLRGESSLSPAERELIASWVSRGNDCAFCTNSHVATTRSLWRDGDASTVDRVVMQGDAAALSAKMQALLELAGAVREGGKCATTELVDRARAAGADDKAIHDTVLIAAAFCMYNRYVDGLATWTPDDPKMYAMIGEMLATRGYLNAVDRM